MADRFGTFVVYDRPTKETFGIFSTEADARGETHELAMISKDTKRKDYEYDYFEVPDSMKTLARLVEEGKDIRFIISDYLTTDSDYDKFEIYYDARSKLSNS